MNFAALIQQFLPTIMGFLKGKSGDDLAGMLEGNTDIVQQVLTAISGANSQAPAAALVANSNNNDLVKMFLDMMKGQAPVIVLPEGMKLANQSTVECGVTCSCRVDQVKLRELEARLELLEVGKQLN